MSEYDYSIHYKRYHDGSLQDIKDMANVHSRVLDPLLKGKSKSTKVLDYGCGNGSLLYYLSHHFEDVTGVDASAQQVATARSHQLPAVLIPLEQFNQWCNNNRENFDIVFLFDVLEHVQVDNQISFMRSIASLLRPEGLIYVKVPNASSLLASRWRYIDWTHRSSFTEASLDFVLMNSGFAQPTYHRDEYQIKPVYWWIPRLSLMRFYMKTLFRWAWWVYLRCELGKEANSISTSINLLAQSKKSL